MKKMKNNKGFALVETLIVSMFIVMTFSIIYNSFIPLLGHYEKAEHQDNIDSKYATYWIKRMIQRSGGNVAEIKTTVSSNTYYQFKCSDITMSNPEEQTRLRNMCLNYLEKANVLCGDVNNYKTNETSCKNGGIPHIYITKYSLDDKDASTFDDLKGVFDGRYATSTDSNLKRLNDLNKHFTTGFADYVNNLPTYYKNENKYGVYRVLVEYKKTVDNKDIFEYGTLEIDFYK